MAAALLTLLTFYSALALGPITNIAASSSPIVQDASVDGSDTVSYTIDDLESTVRIPADLIEFKRPVEPDDPNLAFFNLQKEWVDDYFEENDIYLNAVAKSTLYEYFISMKTGPAITAIGDFTGSSDAVLQALIDSSGSLYTNSSETYTKSEIYRNDSAAYIKSYSEKTENDQKQYSVSYFTVTDGKAITIYLNSYFTAATPAMEEILTNIVDSAQLPVSLEPSPSPSASPSAAVSPSPSNASASPTASSSAQPSQEPETTQPSDEPGATGSETVISPRQLLIYLAITLAIVTLPVAIYRYIIRRRPVSKKAAVLIALIYALVAGIAAVIYIYFNGRIYLIGGVILWSIVNYFILSRGRDKPVSPPPSEQNSRIDTPSLSEAIKSKQCPKCLAVNLADSEECFYCGAKLDGEEKTAE
jgi:hypothetical protein